VTNQNEFTLEALVDFPDDALVVPITAAHIDAMMRRLAELGVRRVSWGYYADGRGGFLTPAHDAQFDNLARTYQGLSQNPLAVAAQAAHRHGLELNAYYKPYETGPAGLFPEGSYEATLYGRLSQIGGRLTWVDPFVVDHAHLRIKRREDDLAPDLEHAPIRSIKLRKADAALTRITREHLHIWASDLNYRYRQLDAQAPFTLTESIEPCPRDTFDLFSGKLVAHRGDPQRVLTIGSLDLRERYVLVTTDFAEGPADFANTDLEMLTALDANGHELPGEIASGMAIWFGERVDFRNWGLMFDTGYNGGLIRLDDPNADGKTGLVAFARGRNAYLPGAMCETEPEVQAFWLRCVQVMLDAGVDGIDFREENHSTHTNHPEDYGYNEVVLAQCRARGQVDAPTMAAVRGDAYTAFLSRARQAINARGKAMRINFQVDWYRADPPRQRRLAYPANIDFQWQRWIDEGLCDQAVLRFFALPFDCVFDDPVAQDVVGRCRAKGIPVTVNRYINPDTLVDEVRRVRQDGRFAGFTLYETASYLRPTADGDCELFVPAVAALVSDADTADTTDTDPNGGRDK
jgi:hypothetical protein